MIGHGHGSQIRDGISNAAMSVLSDLVSDNDIVIGNLEAPLCESSRFQASYAKKSFRGHPEFAKQLDDAGFNLIHIANNHIMQHGPAAFQETIAAISDVGISILGLAGDEGYCSKPVFMRKGEILFGILGYSTVDDPFCFAPRPYAHASPEQICQDVSRTIGKSDVLIVSIHGGLEGSPLPDREQRYLYGKVLESGADIVIGHHSHVVQPMEQLDNGVIIHSLGNFLFDLPWSPETLEGAIAQIEVGKSGVLKNAKVIGTTLEESSVVRILSSKEQQIFGEKLAKLHRLFSLDNDEYELSVERINSVIQTALKRAKVQYFFRNLGKGDTRAKIRFLIDKLTMRL